MLTKEERQYILNALDQEIRRTGLQNAAFALGIVAKLQQEDMPKPQEPSAPANPCEPEEPGADADEQDTRR